MIKSILERIQTNVILLDGGMGSSLIAKGLAHGEASDTWNLTKPDVVKEIHLLYREAGSQVLQSNTFGASPFRLKSMGEEKLFEEINQVGVEIVREAAGGELFIAGNLGPCGAILSPYGDADPIEVMDSFIAQSEILANAGVDYISIETMMDLEEARIALKAAKKGAPGLPVSVTMVFEKKRGEFYSPMGNNAGDSVKMLVEEGADIVGANCSMGSAEMVEMCPAIVEKVNAPVVMKPNAGLPDTQSGRELTYKQSPSEFADHILMMVGRGARLVGGCCGADHRFIAEISKLINTI